MKVATWIGVIGAVAGAAWAEPAKWHPGHYVTCWPGQPARSCERFLASPAVAGVKVVYRWRELEPRPGEYDFSRLEADLAFAQRHGKPLFLTLMEKSWNIGANPPRDKLPVPDYILDDPRYGGGVVPQASGQTQLAAIWHPLVLDRLCALVDALGRRFDGEPGFEGINTDETACSLAVKTQDLTPQAQLDAWKRYASALKTAFPRSTVLIYLNWHPRAAELAAHCAEIGAGFGGPDVVPLTSDRLNPERYPPGKPRRKMEGDRAAEPYLGRVPIGHDVQTPVFGGKEGSPTLEEILGWAVDELKCNYLFWPLITSPRYTFDLAGDIIPFLEREKGRIVAQVPTGPLPAAQRQ